MKQIVGRTQSMSVKRDNTLRDLPQRSLPIASLHHRVHYVHLQTKLDNQWNQFWKRSQTAWNLCKHCSHCCLCVLCGSVLLVWKWNWLKKVAPHTTVANSNRDVFAMEREVLILNATRCVSSIIGYSHGSWSYLTVPDISCVHTHTLTRGKIRKYANYERVWYGCNLHRPSSKKKVLSNDPIVTKISPFTTIVPWTYCAKKQGEAGAISREQLMKHDKPNRVRFREEGTAGKRMAKLLPQKHNRSSCSEVAGGDGLGVGASIWW